MRATHDLLWQRDHEDGLPEGACPPKEKKCDEDDRNKAGIEKA